MLEASVEKQRTLLLGGPENLSRLLDECSLYEQLVEKASKMSLSEIWPDTEDIDRRFSELRAKHESNVKLNSSLFGALASASGNDTAPTVYKKNGTLEKRCF